MSELTGVVLFFCSIASCLIVFIVVLLSKSREIKRDNKLLADAIDHAVKRLKKESVPKSGTKKEYDLLLSISELYASRHQIDMMNISQENRKQIMEAARDWVYFIRLSLNSNNVNNRNEFKMKSKVHDDNFDMPEVPKCRKMKG